MTEAIQRPCGIADPNRPIGSFLFLGPTGVGKTELAKSLADCLFDDEHNLAHRHDRVHGEILRLASHQRLPDNVGYDEGGQLTEAAQEALFGGAVRRAEKAHPDVFNIPFILDDGRITDSQGRTVGLLKYHHHP